jgi:hypothetical protein
MLYEKIADHFVHDLDSGPAGIMDNDPGAALKGPEKITVHQEGQLLARAIVRISRTSVRGGRMLVAVLSHAQYPSRRLKATASA